MRKRGLDDDELEDDELRMLKNIAQESSKNIAQESSKRSAQGSSGSESRCDRFQGKRWFRCMRKRGLDDDELEDDELRMLKNTAQESSKNIAQESSKRSAQGSSGSESRCDRYKRKKRRNKCLRGLDDDELEDDELRMLKNTAQESSKR